MHVGLYTIAALIKNNVALSHFRLTSFRYKICISGFLCVQGLGIAIPSLAPLLVKLSCVSDELLLLGYTSLDRTHLGSSEAISDGFINISCLERRCRSVGIKYSTFRLVKYVHRIKVKEEETYISLPLLLLRDCICSI